MLTDGDGMATIHPNFEDLSRVLKIYSHRVGQVVLNYWYEYVYWVAAYFLANSLYSRGARLSRALPCGNRKTHLYNMINKIYIYIYIRI